MTIVDALWVSRDVAGLPPTTAFPGGSANSDVNGDGQVTIVDALCIARAVAALPLTTACPNPLGP